MTADQHRPYGMQACRGAAQERYFYRQIPLPSSGRAAEWTRQATRDSLASWHLGHLADSALLLVSELVTNAVRHAQTGLSPIALRLEVRGTRLRVEVQDRNPCWPQPRTPSGLDESGFGLLLVAALADKWGVCDVATGKAVWADLDIL